MVVATKITPPVMQTAQINHCSLCGASKELVEKLIVSESAAICSHCIELCNELLEPTQKELF